MAKDEKDNQKEKGKLSVSRRGFLAAGGAIIAGGALSASSIASAAQKSGMKKYDGLKIDAYSHITPPEYRAKYRGKPSSTSSSSSPKQDDAKIGLKLYDLESRFRVLDKCEPIRQVLTWSFPPEEIGDSGKAPELAQVANDGMAELVLKNPDRFVAAIAILPMNNMDAALKEADRAINDLKCRGVYVYTPVSDKPLDSPEFMPLYEKMSRYDLPIFIHPARKSDYPDYRTENVSKYQLDALFGWPYETTLAMARLVCSGILEKYPNLKIVTHHCGAMVPYFVERIKVFLNNKQLPLTKDPIDYFKMFYNDTALYGHTPGLMCAYEFFGADHMMFGADFPYGDWDYQRTINSIDQMDITDDERKKIYKDNAISLMRLSI